MMVDSLPVETVVVNLLGDFEIGFDNGIAPGWRSKKCTNLFAFLVVNDGRPVSRERLEAVLWPHPGRPAGPTALKVLVHTLRRALDAAFGRDRDFLQIDNHGGGYILRLGEQVRVDIHEFERLCRDGGEASGRASADAIAHYSRACGLYRGDFLAGCGEEWVYEYREWLRANMMHALSVLAGHAGHTEDALAAIGHARRMLELDPSEERAFQTMILVHGRRGEYDQVDYWYGLCSQRLAQDLDVAPQEATQRLLLQARHGELIRRRGGSRTHHSGTRVVKYTAGRSGARG
ncbi:BTAD domain-containing putative transcriptional regulator [Nocardia sp. NPDC052566]|uniref:AfsR/SARP family transcriptional regulator n=1 Tax=Nocardia sp. NPDC052566 TaxID=3364330 RepID=UPI0037C50DC0